MCVTRTRSHFLSLSLLRTLTLSRAHFGTYSRTRRSSRHSSMFRNCMLMYTSFDLSPCDWKPRTNTLAHSCRRVHRAPPPCITHTHTRHRLCCEKSARALSYTQKFTQLHTLSPPSVSGRTVGSMIRRQHIERESITLPRTVADASHTHGTSINSRRAPT